MHGHPQEGIWFPICLGRATGENRRIAQPVERPSYTGEVVGSTPAPPTTALGSSYLKNTERVRSPQRRASHRKVFVALPLRTKP